MRKTLILLIVLFLGYTSIFPQEIKSIDDYTKEEIMNLTYDDLLKLSFEDLIKLAEKLGVSVDDLLNMKISVTSKSLMTPRESPGIVSIITDKEIKNSGARDLIDILNLVPGFHFGYDIDGAIGLAARGNWGHEGKILILLDGLELNENFYSTYQFGNRIATDQIKRIEIIRGPGSCIYGGYAELGVINIITREGNDLKGAEITTSHGLMKKGALRNEISFQKGDKIEDFDYSVGLFVSNAHRSSIEYQTFDGDKYKLFGDDGKMNSRYANISFAYKKLKSRFAYDKFETKALEYPSNPLNSFSSYLGEIKYDWNINDKISIVPKINIKNQEPWRMEDTSYSYLKNNLRVVSGLSSQVILSKNISIVAGGEYLADFANDNLENSFFYNGNKKISFSNTSAYVQTYINTKYINFNIGGRYDYHDYVGGNFAPRVGVTKVFNKLHFKFLYSQAFRAPAIENINVNQTIEAEKTYVNEMEVGYQVNKYMFITANVFTINITNPIVYQINNDTEGYVNYPETGSKGLELEYRLMRSSMNISLNYSYYSSLSNKVDDYEVVPDKTYLQAFPKYKLTLNSWFKLGENLSMAPSGILNGPKYGYSLNDAGLKIYNKFSKQIFLNVFFTYSNIYLKNLDLGFGVYNILDENNYFIQAYGDALPAVPGYTREFMLKLSYQF